MDVSHNQHTLSFQPRTSRTSRHQHTTCATSFTAPNHLLSSRTPWTQTSSLLAQASRRKQASMQGISFATDFCFRRQFDFFVSRGECDLWLPLEHPKFRVPQKGPAPCRLGKHDLTERVRPQVCTSSDPQCEQRAFAHGVDRATLACQASGCFSAVDVAVDIAHQPRVLLLSLSNPDTSVLLTQVSKQANKQTSNHTSAGL
eukprot:1658481-Rhodomonas_salina.2